MSILDGHIHPIVLNQRRFSWRRRVLRDGLLRPLGFGALVKPNISGRERIPATGPLIVIMNHIAAIDPFVVAGIITNRFLVPMSKAENLGHPLINMMIHAWGVYPVRRGEADRVALASTLELLRQEYAVLIAPEGTRNDALIEAKDGTTYVATKGNALILPIGLEGTDQFPRALKLLRRIPVTVTVGRPFRFRTAGPRVPRKELRQMTREMMYQLAQLVPEQRRGVYGDLAQLTTDMLVFVD
ncbi:MAG: 1-acyl-sn-glycerol-3-phosphate acyltransferase [Anaerolineae bacterium]|nr:1-acyl-sn-glycerol-3-phosphate acyltransferase [Anaerolineae bacterium]